MSMHLEGPWLSTTGRRKGRVKFRSAEQKRQAEELAKNWENLMQKYPATKTKQARPLTAPLPRLAPPPGRETPHIPSLNGGKDSASATKSPDKVYTGTKIIGIGTMHKSNAVPIFSSDDAKAIATMRR